MIFETDKRSFSTIIQVDNKISENPNKIKNLKSNLGKGWFNLSSIEQDEKLRRDLKLIQLRNYMDPKRSWSSYSDELYHSYETFYINLLIYMSLK